MIRTDVWLNGLAIGLLFVGTLACESQVPGAQGVEVRDSLGVRIVESAVPAWASGSEWRLSDAAVLEIGTVEGAPAEQFSEIMGVARLGDGRWVIADGVTSELRLFDNDGSYVATLTRQGSGPEELLRISSFQRLPGDLLAVQETAGESPRFAFIDAKGGFVRRTQLSAPTPGLAFAVTGWLDDTTAVVSERVRPSLSPGEQDTPEVTFSRIGPDGTVTQEITSVRGLTFYGRETGPPVGVTMGGRLLRHVSPGGLLVALPEGAEVRRYQLDGTLTMVLRQETSSVDVDSQLIAEYIDAYVASFARAGAPPEALSEARQRVERTNIFAERVPTYSRVLADREGNVWVREWVVHHALPQMQALPTFESPDRWAVFDASGRWLGHVETPPRFFVFEIGTDYVAGLYRDELDVERIRVYELMKQ